MSLYSIRKQQSTMPIGIVISNDSAKDQDVQCLGYDLTNPPEGVTLTNMFGETLFEDKRLGHLRNWLLAVGRIRIKMTRFATNHASQFQETVYIREQDPNGMIRQMDIRLLRHKDPMTYTANMIDFMKELLISYCTEINTKIKAFSGLQIMFYPWQDNDDSGMFNAVYSKIKEENEDFSKEKRKQFLFLR